MKRAQEREAAELAAEATVADAQEFDIQPAVIPDL